MGSKCSVMVCVILKPTLFCYISDLQPAMRGGWEFTLPHFSKALRDSQGPDPIKVEWSYVRPEASYWRLLDR